MKIIDAILSLFKRRDGGVDLPYPYDASAKAFFSQFMRQGAPALVEPYAQSPFAFACIEAVARNFKRVPIRLMRGDPEGDNERVDEHEIVALLNRPNPITTKAKLLDRYVKHRFLTGASMWILLAKDGNPVRTPVEIPTEIWPYPATRFEMVPREDGFGYEGWRFKKANGLKLNLMPHQVIAHRFEDPLDAMKLFAPVVAALIPLSQHFEMDKWNEALFKNSATPDGYIQLEGGVSPGKKETVEETLRDRLQGSWNQFKTLVLQHGAKWVRTGDTQKDMQFLEGKQEARKLVQMVFGVNDYELGQPDDVNRATALAFRELLFTSAIIPQQRDMTDESSPYVDRWEPGGKLYLVFDNSGIEALKQGFGERLTQAKDARDLGFSLRQINERFELGMNLDDMEPEVIDLHLVPTSLQTLDSLVSLPEADDEDEDDEDQEIPGAGDEEDEEDEEEEEEEKQRAADHAYWDHVVRTYFNPREKVFRAKVQRFFRDMRKQVLANLSKVKAAEAVSGNGSPAGLLAPPRADPKKIVYEATSAFKRLLQLVGPVYDGVQKDAIESLAKDLGKLKVVNQDTPSLLALLRLKKMKIRRVSETVRKQLRAQIILSTKKGEGIEKLKERLKRVFKFANSRALTVARTEVSGTWSGTRFHGMKEEGTKKHRWIDSRDEVVRETHHKCSGEVREIGKPFPNGLIHPHDPDGEAGEVINCRCICVPV